MMTELQQQIKEALQSGQWMLRRSNGGRSFNNFQWKPVGEWTEAPDWNPNPTCGGGLHGNGPSSIGYWTSDPDLDFCVIDGDIVEIDEEKIKVQRAMVALRNELPDGLQVGGSLDLSGTQITELPDGLQVGDYLYLRGTQITELPNGLQVGGSLDLSDTQITELPDGLQVGDYLDLSDTQITELPDGLQMGGCLYLSGTQITELPDGLQVGGSLYLRGTQITELPDGLQQKAIN